MCENCIICLTEDGKTEEELKGQSLTPDFLLKDMGKYKWLDAKNYPHFDSKMTREKLKKQATKYTDAFGPGIFVFDGGSEKRISSGQWQADFRGECQP